MKKLRLEDLAVDSFITASRQAGLGTVKAHTGIEGCYTNTNSEYSACPTCGSGGAGCTDNTANADCPGTGTGGTSEGTLCGTRDCSADSCTGPYGCPCTTTLSYDYTFCEFHSTCINC